MPEAVPLFVSPGLYLGNLRCPPDDDTWGEDAIVTNTIVALPSTPTWVVRRGTERHLVNANHAVIHQPGDEYRRERFEGRGYRCLFMYPGPGLIREIASEFDPAARNSSHIRIPAGLTSIDPRSFSVSRGLARYLSVVPDPDGIRTTETLYRLLRAIIAGAYGQGAHGQEGRTVARTGRSTTPRAHSAIAEETKEALTSRFAQRLTIEGLASSVHVSPYHLTRVFRRQTGFALHEYLNQLRLRAAFDRILDGAEDLAALAADLGFSGHSHLTANFRQMFGMPPRLTRAAGSRGWLEEQSQWPAKRARI